MPTPAKIYISCIVTSGLIVLLSSIRFLRTDGAAHFAFLALLALVASGMKVRLPRITGTYSLNFLIILISITTLSFSQTALLAAASALVQCLWRPCKRPSLVQVLFNVAALTLTASVCQMAYRLVEANSVSEHEVSVMALIATLYWIANTGFVSGVLALLSEGTLREIWGHWYLWSLPYYLAGAIVAGTVTSIIRRDQWLAALAILPIMGLVYVSYRLWMEGQHAAARSQSAA